MGFIFVQIVSFLELVKAIVCTWRSECALFCCFLDYFFMRRNYMNCIHSTNFGTISHPIGRSFDRSNCTLRGTRRRRRRMRYKSAHCQPNSFGRVHFRNNQQQQQNDYKNKHNIGIHRFHIHTIRKVATTTTTKP